MTLKLSTWLIVEASYNVKTVAVTFKAA